MQDFFLVWNQDCELVSQLPKYRETDWDFIKRLSTHLGVPIYAANDYMGQGVWYRDKVSWPFAVDIVLRDGMLHCISKLAKKDYHTTDISYNPDLKGLSLTGKVLKREEELIKNNIIKITFFIIYRGCAFSGFILGNLDNIAKI